MDKWQGRVEDGCLADFAGEQNSVIGSKWEVVGGANTGKKGCHRSEKG